MTSPRASEERRRRWADPDYRARTLAAQRAGVAASPRPRGVTDLSQRQLARRQRRALQD